MLAPRPSFLGASFYNNLLAFVLTGGAFSIYAQESLGGCGDYPQNFEVLYKGMAIGFAVWMVFHFVYPYFHYSHLVQPFLLAVIRYFLASIILSYGFAKVFASQFPHTMANMDARFVELTPMRVAWAFFGYSRGYQQFLGLGEVVPAVLLLFRRTTLLGAILMFTVMLNVFVVNVFFDVCVKLNSGIYMVLALYLMLQHTGRLWTFFFSDRITWPPSKVSLEKPRWMRYSALAVNVLALGYVGWTNGQGAFQTYQYATTQVALTPVQGPWRTASLKKWTNGQWESKTNADTLSVDRVFFDGYNGVIKSELLRDRFRFTVDSASHSLEVRFTNLRNEWNIPPVRWSYERTAPDSLNLWIRWKQDSLHLNCYLRKEPLTRY